VEHADLDFLLADEGRRWLAEASQKWDDAKHIALAEWLRREIGARAGLVLTQVQLRRRAVAKFSHPERMYFTAQALEQSSSEPVARHRARRFLKLAPDRIWDLCSGLGGDALALSAAAPVVAVDRQSVLLRILRENVRQADVAAPVDCLCADVSVLHLPRQAVWFADPSRRSAEGDRKLRPESYSPPLSKALSWLERAPSGCIKMGPAARIGALPAGAELEFVSLAGEVKEAVLWFGDLASSVLRRASILPAGESLSGAPDDSEPPLSPVQEYLYEPDGAVLRARLVQKLATRLDAAFLDPEVAYLSASSAAPSPFARLYRVEDDFPFQLLRLRHYLRAKDVGRITLKRRGSAVRPQELLAKLKLRGSEHRAVFLTRLRSRPWVIVAEPLAES
jgi:hypothetical protein